MSLIPHLSEIAKATGEIEAATTVNEVIGIFRNNPALTALPVVENGELLAVMSRKVLFSRHLGRPYAMDLFGKRPVRELLDDRLPVMEPGWDINTALGKLLEHDPELETDSFAVTLDGGRHAIVSVPDLMMKHAESQARLLETLQQLSARIREEVEKASLIQQALLPPRESRFDRITVNACLVTSSEIGGDFYDYFPLAGGRLGLVIGDVSGHGVQSGMVTTAAKASLHTLIAQGVDTPAELLHGMNNAILATVRQTLLMTCLIAVINPARRELVLANAGHNFPYLHRQGERRVTMINEAAGYPLGFEPDNRYPEITLPFAGGDLVFLYSDGILECTDPDGEEFGYGRMEAFLTDHCHLSPGDLKQRLLETAARFTGAGTFDDDVTILIAASDHP
jgi:serine phosphatase RsbU (regulator of sigma subunit)